jgi:serine/threonine protein kinase
LSDLQEVAIKMLYQSDQKAQQAFLREISMLKYASRDRNVVQFYGVSIQSSGIWLITEHMEVTSFPLL